MSTGIFTEKRDGMRDPAGCGRGRIRTGQLQPGLFIGLVSALMVIGMLTGPAGAYTTPDSLAAATKLSVTNVTYDPSVFFTGDSGTVTFEVTNGAADQGIVVNHATVLTDKNFRTTSPSYDYSATIGPGKSKEFSFTLIAAGNNGKYFPTFSLNLRDADNLWQTAMVEVDNTPLELTLHSKPDTFTRGKKDTINVQVANPRNNAVKNVILEITGDGMEISPSRIFIGTLIPGESKIFSPAVTPLQEAPVTLHVMYDNGDNPHETSTVFPVVFDTNKKRAEPIISNVAIENLDGIYRVTGDVTNAGLETANAVTVTSLPPAIEEDPYKTYIVGALKADDFASFEVTFSSASAPVIPLQVSYKDDDGNVFSSVAEVKLGKPDSGPGSVIQKQGSDTPATFHNTVIHVIIGIVLVAILMMAGLFAYNHMKKR